MIAPTVSIIVPCYKMGRYVSEALESVGSQIYSDWEVIIVDDAGPEDGTRQAVADFAARFPDHKIEFIRHEVNCGVSAARNTAIGHARGKYLAFLDPDDLWLPEKLFKQLQTFDSDKDTTICYSQARILRLGAGINCAPGIEITGNPPEIETAAAVLGIASGKIMFAFSTLVLRKNIFDEVGGFQEKLPFQNEDRILIGSSALFGRMTWVPEPLCIYRLHDGSATTMVIQKKTVSLVELDLCTRLALWLCHRNGGRRIGARIVRELLVTRVRNVLGTRSWFRLLGLIFGLGAKLAFNYPGATAFLMCQMLIKFPAPVFRRGLRGLGIKVFE